MNPSPAPPVVAPVRVAPLSTNQLAQWFYSYRYPHAPPHFWHLPLAIRIAGALDGAVFQRCADELVRRHPVVRTTFAASAAGWPEQRVHPSGPAAIRFVDLRGVAPTLRRREADGILAETLRAPFDLAAAPCWRAVLLRLADDEHVFFVSIHHLVGDAWSQAVLFRELAALYEAFVEGRPSPLPEPTRDYTDYVARQQERLAAGVLEDKLRYWEAQLTPPPRRLDLPADRPRPAVRGFAGAIERFALPAAVRRAAEATGRRHGTTAFSVLLAAFYLLLHRVCGRDDLLVGVPVANRSGATFRDVFGCFAKSLPLRVDVADDPTFAALLARVHRALRQGVANQEAPLVKVYERLPGFDADALDATTQVTFIYQSALLPRVALDGLTFEMDLRWDLLDLAREDLLCQLFATPDGLDGVMEYRTDLFDRSTVAALVAAYRRLLDDVLHDPERPLSAYERPARSRPS